MGASYPLPPCGGGSRWGARRVCVAEDSFSRGRSWPPPQPLPTRGGVHGRIHINADQYFEGVPEIAWTFHIGGYQPAQKWPKDRRGRSLSFEDITHYQRIIKILAETGRIMKEIELALD